MSESMHGRSLNKPIHVRLNSLEERDQFFAVTEAAGDVPSKLVKHFVAWYLGHTDELPNRPIVERQHQQLKDSA